ncbi:slr1659 superfamily regulator [Thioalkalivibrio sulfidiphilus]|uniref:STAS domain-containing protein n=1 Tax=Thioalkalivibrio sulfidiphilus (strain HL-EbGR7) TaxID=396588 RepID=B8GRX6_THISH|nr:STAS domain-containing protein [Thioalkalivibrio sulfidiphilus]ACL72680.1 conserved hypothetical protein [Thioalkalivibrio sulfidiphilus HL-EbGr7]
MHCFSGEGYKIELDDTSNTVRMSGALRLGGLSEYAPISELLENALDGREALIIDLSALEFLNSSGIATLSKFVITARNRNDCRLAIQGSNAIAWQGKSLNNLKRLMPALELNFD